MLTPNPHHPKTRTPFALLATLGLLTGLGSICIDIYLPSLPTLSKEFSAGTSAAQLTLSAFFIGFGLGQLVYGPVSDRFGRRRPLAGGMVVLALASLGCALARSIEQLIAMRALQAFGACAGPVLARAVVRDLCSHNQAARMLSILMVLMGLAPILGPLLGGLILLGFGWRAIFVLLAIIGGLAFVATLLILPETLPAERRLAVPLRELVPRYISLLTDRRFLGGTISSSLVYAGMFAYISGSPFVFIQVFGIPPQYFGFFFGLNAAGLIACATLNSKLVVSRGSHDMFLFGVSTAAVAGTALFLVSLAPSLGLAPLLVPLFFYVASVAMASANGAAIALTPFPDRAGAASAVIGAVQFGIAAVSGGLVGWLHDGSARPMAGVIAACGLSALVARAVFLGGHRQSGDSNRE